MYFRRLLERLSRELDLFAVGERPNYALMLDILTYLGEFCDRVHHPREDAAFACLARRFPDLQLPLARLQQEHRVIAHAGEVLRTQIAAIVDGAFVPRAEVEAPPPPIWSTTAITSSTRSAKSSAAPQPRSAKRTGKRCEPLRRTARPPLSGAAPHERFRQLRRGFARKLKEPAMFAIFFPRRERRVIDAGRVCCPLRRRDVEVTSARAAAGRAIDVQSEAPSVRCTAELVRVLPDSLLV